MPSTTDSDRPEEAVALAQQYLKSERRLSRLVAVVVAGSFLATYLATSFLPALVVGVAIIVVIRTPVLRPHGAVELRSDDDPETVRAAFEGATPPVLGLQWGIANEVTTENDTPTYTMSYLFGLRSVEMAVESRTETTADGAVRVELQVTANGQSWATYTATIRDDGSQTAIDVTYESDRRFGLRRLPQQFVADRYRDGVLEAQGYTVVERDSNLR